MVTSVSTRYPIVYHTTEFLKDVLVFNILIMKKLKETLPLVPKKLKEHKWKVLGSSSLSLALLVVALYKLNESYPLLRLRTFKVLNSPKDSQV